VQTASRRRRIARGAGRSEVDVTNMIGTFGGMRSKMQSLSKMMQLGGGGGARAHLPPLQLSTS
jgi:signal recognition particle GTPase